MAQVQNGTQNAIDFVKSDRETIKNHIGSAGIVIVDQVIIAVHHGSKTVFLQIVGGKQEIRRRHHRQQHAVESALAGEEEIQSEHQEIDGRTLLDKEHAYRREIHGNVASLLKEVEGPEQEEGQEAVLVNVIEAPRANSGKQCINKHNRAARL